MEKARVLIVDDQPNWRQLFVELLDDEYEVVDAENYPQAAVAVLENQEHPFHVAVLDIRLVDADSTNEQGLSLAGQLRAASEHTNIIVVTGYPTVRTVKKAFKSLNAFEYVEKYPEDGKQFDYKQFCSVVQEAAMEAQGKTLTCNRGRLCTVLDENSTDVDVRKLLYAMQEKYGESSIRSYEDLAGKSKWRKIDYLLGVWKTHHEDLCEVCEIYRTQIRLNSEQLKESLRAICSRNRIS